MSREGDRLAERVSQLERNLRDRSLLVADLVAIMEEYGRERSRLSEEIMSFGERLWDLRGPGSFWRQIRRGDQLTRSRPIEMAGLNLAG